MVDAQRSPAIQRPTLLDIRFPFASMSLSHIIDSAAAPGPTNRAAGRFETTMALKTMSYNLLDEEWIPVLYRDGTYKRVGIREALKDAGLIRQIAASNPMDRVAILRFLLALLYWCKGNPPDDVRMNVGMSFPAEWFKKLDDNRDCFNLLGDGKRFYQDRAAQRRRATTDLLQEIPTGNNFWHFRHSTDGLDGLCPACCAIGLLRLPLFSVSGLPDLKAGINGTPPVYVAPWGYSLLMTLTTNWMPSDAIGEPVWVETYAATIQDEDVPLLAGLTMLSRRVWLHDPEGDGTCIGCGMQKTAVIRTCEFQTAGKQENALWTDPQVVYLDKTPRKAMKARDLSAASKFRMDRPWPDLLARMAETGRFGPNEKGASLLIVGFATDQAKNIDVWERTVSIAPGMSIKEMSPSPLLQWAKEGARMERRIGRSKVEGSAVVAAIRPHIEDSVSAKAGQLVGGDDEAWKEMAQEYRWGMGAVAESLSPGFTAGAIRRRRYIAGAKPDMRPKVESTEKPGRKKGADK
jgi:hypothetical protein